MSLSNIKGRLTRSELKTIMAGSGVYDGNKAWMCCYYFGKCSDCASGQGFPTCSPNTELRPC
ncbi:hypothetical protein [Flavobacterium sp. 9]|uniref:hypothetical protein n=1 Tax=Flavobacterium sp. 9 TaxID=2035198 RepID=UPI0011981D66|nr:hypothetical protein [Flavobacterium sp. 9]